MPIYEYVCNECGERFEKLLFRLAAEEHITCPYCGSHEIERAVSGFATFGSCAPTARGYG